MENFHRFYQVHNCEKQKFSLVTDVIHDIDSSDTYPDKSNLVQ